MYEADYFILCREVKRSPEGTDLLGIYEQVRALKFPMPFPRLQAQVRLRAIKPVYGESINGKIEVEHENKVVFSVPLNLKNASALKNQRIPININFNELSFPESGDYYFRFYIDDKLLATEVLQAVLDNE
jgi:hypothetical protein